MAAIEVDEPGFTMAPHSVSLNPLDESGAVLWAFLAFPSSFHAVPIFNMYEDDHLRYP